jgi:hypothetical protein
VPPLNPNTLPQDVQVLHKIVLELSEQLRHESAEKGKYPSLLRELLEAQRQPSGESSKIVPVFDVNCLRSCLLPHCQRLYFGWNRTF